MNSHKYKSDNITLTHKTLKVNGIDAMHYYPDSNTQVWDKQVDKDLKDKYLNPYCNQHELDDLPSYAITMIYLFDKEFTIIQYKLTKLKEAQEKESKMLTFIKVTLVMLALYMVLVMAFSL